MMITKEIVQAEIEKLSEEDLQKVYELIKSITETETETHRKKLSDFFRESPLAGADPDPERDKSPVRDGVVL
ncbi:MAG: hypothetical protein U0Z53_11580 [Blastocatellia bacterium]